MTSPHERLRDLGLALPAPPVPLASYIPTRLVPIGDGRSLVYIAGQISARDGKRLTGRCPDQVRVEQVVQLTGFVLSTEDFGDQPKVMNSASDLIAEVLGEAGKHTRVAVGAHALPFSVTVEIAAVAVVRTG